jgi:hypothetical protein
VVEHFLGKEEVTGSSPVVGFRAGVEYTVVVIIHHVAENPR